VNLSIGGPDYLDYPFVDKVNEMGAAGIVFLSAIGNDGPRWGTLMSPADQVDVTGTGGIDWNSQIAGFSSRGMTVWELPTGYGRFKPDLVTFGASVTGSAMNGGCTQLSGTSVASPVMTGAMVALMSSVPPAERASRFNLAIIKQAIVETAKRLPRPGVFEQGSGKMDAYAAYEWLHSDKGKPHASALPAELFLEQCPYMWPFCEQAIYAGGMPTIVNVTILNSMGVVGWYAEAPVWRASNPGMDQIDIEFSYLEET